MSDQTPENGDEIFQKFLDNSSPDNFSLIVLTLREKTRHLSAMYNMSLGAYLKLPDNDPMRMELRKFIPKLWEQSIQSLTQFDFLLMDDTEEDVGEGDVNKIDPEDPASI
jgi:hypothetical protein